MDNYIYIIIFLCLNIFIHSPLLSQSAYIQLNTGYALGISQQSIPDGNITFLGNDRIALDILKHSYGKGGQVSTILGNRFNKMLAAQVGVAYLVGGKVSRRVDNGVRREVNEIQSSMVRMMPEIKLRLGLKKVNAYTHLGLVIGLGGRIEQELTGTNNGNEVYAKTVYNEGVSYGATAAISFEWQITEHLYFSNSMRMFVQSYAPEKREIVASRINGQSNIADLDAFERYTLYSDSYEKDIGLVGVDVNKPAQAIKQFQPFNSIGIDIGLVYYFKKLDQ